MVADPQSRPLPAETEEEGLELTFLEHLEELRKRLIWSILALVVAAVGVFAFAEPITHLLMVPVLHALPEGSQNLVFTSSVETFFAYMRVAVWAGIFIAAPVILFQIWRFVAPGLYDRERKLLFPFVLFGTLMFVGGAVFAYFVILPNAFKFLIEFSGAADWAKPMLTLKEQLSLVLMLELAFGLIFEIPLIIAFLAFIGLVDAKTLSKYRRYAAIVAATVAAVITPTGDPFNLALMAVPMYLFYEVGILAAWFIGSRREEREKALAEADRE